MPNKLKRVFVKADEEHSNERTIIKAKATHSQADETDILTKRVEECSSAILTETRLETSAENTAIASSRSIQSMGTLKNEPSEYGEITCKYETKKVIEENAKVLTGPQNVDTEQTDKQFLELVTEAPTSNEEVTCDAKKILKREHLSTEPPVCVLTEQNMEDRGDITCISHEKMKVMEESGKALIGLQKFDNTEKTEKFFLKSAAEAPTSNEEVTHATNKTINEEELENVSTEPSVYVGQVLNEYDTKDCDESSIQETSTLKTDTDTCPDRSNILHHSQNEISEDRELEQKSVSPKTMIQALPVQENCLVMKEEHNAKNETCSDEKVNAATESYIKMPKTISNLKEHMVKNIGVLESFLTQAHESSTKEEPSDGECSDIIGNSQDESTNPVLQLTMISNSRAQEDQDMFKACTQQTSSSELRCSQNTRSIPSDKSKQEGSVDGSVSAEAEIKGEKINHAFEDENFDHLFLKQGFDTHDKPSQDCNQSNKNKLIPDKQEYEKQQNENQPENDKLEPESFSKEAEIIIEAEIKGEKLKCAFENENFDNLLLKQEFDTHEKSTQDGIQSNKSKLILDEQEDVKQQNKNQPENEKLEESSSKEAGKICVTLKNQSQSKNQPKSEICSQKSAVKQNPIPESIASTSVQIANLDDELEISTSQLLELETEFGNGARLQHDSHPQQSLNEPTERQSLLPRQLRMPTVDWTQRAEHNRQRLQSIIQDICKLNALLMRARRMMWKQ
ncbi:uncharacterized protein LOC134531756 isoform X2 [Bacillus rossius redtenbacheri]